MVKGHAAAAGELLRGSAAWRALRRRYPQAKLHLWLLSTDAGGPAEELIGSHHLIYTFQSSRAREARFWGWPRWFADARKIGERVRPDLIVDFEADGLVSAILCRFLASRCKCACVGVGETPWRAWFYNAASPPISEFARQYRLPLPMKETDQTFLALSALGIEREPLSIELRETRAALQVKARMHEQLRPGPILGLNIGSGLAKDHLSRPDEALLAGLVAELQVKQGYSLLLTGGPLDDEINSGFLSRHPPQGRFLNIAGKCTIRELVGAIASCDVFVTGYSDAYHMAVALGVPTLAIFNYPQPTQYHEHEWVRCVVGRGVESLPVLLEEVARVRGKRRPDEVGRP